MIDKLKEYPQWKINLEIEPETWDSVEVNDPVNYARFHEYYLTSGRNRIEFVNPTYAQTYCFNVCGESIIRQFYYGMKKIKEHFPDATFLTYSCEEPCFTSCLPQILTSFGFRYAVLKNPDTCWGGYTSAFGKDLVNWKSSDGSSILAVPRYACEKLVAGSTWQTTSWNNSEDFVHTCFKNGIKYPVGMC
jgi:alpha-mannosidase